MNKILTATLVTLLALMSGCASSHQGEMLDAYSPKYIGAKPDDKGLAFIKTTDDLIIVSVDGVRHVNFMKVMAGSGLDSIKVKEGKHSILASYGGVDIRIGYTFYKADHEYLIDYFKDGKRISYWISDLTDNTVIYGKEVKPEVK